MLLKHFKFFLLILFCFVSFVATAQKKHVKKEKRRYPLTFLSVEYGAQYSQLFLNKNYLLYGIFDENIGYRGHSAWNFTGQYGKSFNKNVDLMIGLAHDRQQIIQTRGFTYLPCDLARYGATKIDSAERIVKSHRIEIPIDFRYRFYYKNFAFAPTIGLGLAFYNARNESVDMILDNGKIGENFANDDLMQQTRGLNLISSIKLGMIYEVDNNLTIKIEPFYKHYVIKEQILKEYKKVNPFGMGVMIGIEHTLDMAARPVKKPKKKK
jgi:hypothetical protein